MKKIITGYIPIFGVVLFLNLLNAQLVKSSLTSNIEESEYDEIYPVPGTSKVDSAFQKIKDCRNNEGNDIENKNNGRNIFLICAKESCNDGKLTTTITTKKEEITSTSTTTSEELEPTTVTKKDTTATSTTSTKKIEPTSIPNVHVSFQWINDCDYNGNDIETKYGINSFMRCAEICFNNTNCNYFTFDPQISICSLKHVFDSTHTEVSSKGSICGMFPSRTSQSTLIAERQWKTSKDGSFKWASGCNFIFFDVLLPVVLPNVTACGEYCQANIRCNIFTFRLNDKTCLPKKRNGLITGETTMTDLNFSCGFIPDRKYNVESFITNCK